MRNKELTLEAISKIVLAKEKELSAKKPLLNAANAKLTELKAAVSDAAAEADEATYKKLKKELADVTDNRDFLLERVNFLESSVVPGVSDEDIVQYWNDNYSDMQRKLDNAKEKIDKARANFMDSVLAYEKVLAELNGARTEYGMYMNGNNGIGRLRKFGVVKVNETVNMNHTFYRTTNAVWDAALKRITASFSAVSDFLQ